MNLGTTLKVAGGLLPRQGRVSPIDAHQSCVPGQHQAVGRTCDADTGLRGFRVELTLPCSPESR